MMGKEIVKNFCEFAQSGVVSLTEWLMAPTGDQYKYFYCNSWMILTDGMVPIDKFKTGDHWGLMAVTDKGVQCVIVGCRIAGFVKCDRVPKNQAVYAFE